MNVKTLRNLNEGLSALEKYAVQKGSSADTPIEHLNFNVSELRALRMSLKNPEAIDIKNWVKLIRSLQDRSKQLGEPHEINERVLVASLKKYRDGVEAVASQGGMKKRIAAKAAMN